MTLTMYDSTSVADIPATGMDAVAGYVGGRWPTYAALVARFPHLPALSIAVNSTQDAQCLDVEPGDATPAAVPAWLDRQAQLHPGRTPIIYTSASQIPAVRAAAGNRKYLLWSAHYGKGPHICGSCGFAQADATQWDDHGPNGEHIDRTLMTPAFLAAFAPAAPKPPASSIPAVFRKVVTAVVRVFRPAPVLKVGSTGPAVHALQYGLNHMFPAYSKLATDSKFGPSTEAVVKEYQRRTWPNTPTAWDGVVGPNTRAALKRSGITF